MKTLLRNPWLLIALFALGMLWAGTESGWARPGGGHSYKSSGSKSSGSKSSSSKSSSSKSKSKSSSSSSSSSSSGGSGGGGSADFGLFFLSLYQVTADYPEVMLPLYGFGVLYVVVMVRRARRKPLVVSTKAAHREQSLRERQVRNYRKHDPNFSEPLFLDFASSLYHEFYQRYGTPSFGQLQPFVLFMILDEEKSTTMPRTYSDIVVGSLHIGSITHNREGWDLMSVALNTNRNVHSGGKITRYYCVEAWHFRRKTGVLSLPPQKLQSLACVQCAAPLSLTNDSKCRSCGHYTEPGQEQWLLYKQELVSSQPVGNPRGSLLTYVPEEGNNLPTLLSPSLQDGIKALMNSEGGAQWTAYQQHFIDDVVKPCFMILYKNWSERKWEPVRPILTDRLFESQRWWIDEYKRQGLINKLDNIEIQKIETARVEVDAFYAAITVRIFAKCLDYTTDESGQVLKGSPKSPRAFTEYWTFVKNAKVQSGDKPSATTKSCPSCGAAVKINLAGKCEFCASKVTDGAFNWVLSRIEQDDDYGY